MTDSAHPLATNGRVPQAADWGWLLAAHEDWLRKVILARTGQRQAVDEVFQQVALAAVAQRTPLQDLDNASAWLHRLAVIQSSLYRRKAGRGRRAVNRLAELQAEQPEPCDAAGLGWLLRRERVELVRQALTRLEGKDVEILMLKYGERWSYRQISQRLGISEKAVDCRLMRARERLRAVFRGLGLEEDDL